jgi:hypothetical protein
MDKLRKNARKGDHSLDDHFWIIIGWFDKIQLTLQI